MEPNTCLVFFNGVSHSKQCDKETWRTANGISPKTSNDNGRWRDPILWKKHQDKEQNRRSLFTLWGWSVDNSLFQKASEWFGVFYESVLLCDLCQDHALSSLSFLVCSFVSRCFVLCYMHTWVHAKQHRENHILEN